ncbi:MAG: histidine kinase N-terminal 7TM domain-containing protein [Haloglomus sp.]
MGYRLGNPYTLALLVAAAMMFGLAAVTLRHRQKRGARAFFGFLVGIGLWSLADAMRYAAPTESAVLLWNQVGYLGIVAIPPTLLLFVLSYTGRDRWFRKRYLAVLFAISAAAYAFVLTNPLHGLWFDIASLSPGTAPPVLQEAWGLAWFAWAGYSYAVVLAALYLMTREFLVANRSRTHRGQTGMLLAGILVAAGVNALFIFDLVAFDPAPFVFAVTGLCFGVAMFRYKLLTLLPIARDTVVRNMDSGVVVLDRDDRLVDVNERGRSMFDLDRSNALGTPVASALADYPAVREQLGADRSDEPVEVETDGEVRHYDLETSDLTDALDAYVGRVVVFTDITQRVEQQRRLQQRTSELERTNERLDQFASVVSHDLRNPLNVILGRVQLARQDDDVTEHLDEIAAAADRMDAMVEDLLTLARQGRTVGETEQVRLDEVVEQAWELTDSDEARLTCTTSATVHADPDRLREALGNLFRNSVEHAGAAADGGTTPDESDVHIRVGDLEDGFLVEDDGQGIPETEREQVFDPGYTTHPDGTGFGLNIVHDIVQAHGWRIDVTDGQDGGARFEIRGVEVE